MLKIINAMTTLCFCITLTACSAHDTQKSLNNGDAQWDFDHNIQFRQKKLTSNQYQLEIIPSRKVKFELSAAFLLRQSYNICGSYLYKIEIIRGVEGFDDKRAMPNYIVPSLIAKLECKLK